MIYSKKIQIVLFLFAVFAGWYPAVCAAENTVDPREAAIDRAIGGIVEGSRPLSPQNNAGEDQVQKIPGGALSPSMDTRVTASAGAGANLGGGANAGADTGGAAQETTGGGAIGGSLGGSTGGGTVGGSPGGATSGGGTETGGGTTEPVTEPASGGGPSESIVNVGANVDLSGGSPAVDANLSVDTNAEGGLLDANAATTTDTTTTDVTAVESGQIAGEDLTAAVEGAPIDAILDAEVVATDAPPESEATAGLEASVDEISAGSDVTATDSADGLSTTL